MDRELKEKIESKMTNEEKIENDIAEAKLKELLSERPHYTIDASKAQEQHVMDMLLAGEFIDFNKALKRANKTQRLSAIIWVLRHDKGMKIVDWIPDEEEYGGSVYALYEFAPYVIKRRWSFLDSMAEDDVREYFYGYKPRDVLDDQIEGQMDITEVIEDMDGKPYEGKIIFIPKESVPKQKKKVLSMEEMQMSIFDMMQM